MNQRNQLLCAWCGPVFAALFGLGFWLFSQFVPPHAPSADAIEITGIYIANVTMIRSGQILLMLASALTVPFTAVIMIQMMRIEGRKPVLAYTQFGSGVLAAVFLLLPTLLFTAAAFRPERSPDLTQLVNDLAWLVLLMTFSPAFVQLLAIGLATLADKTARPVFPRWSGFFNLWVAVLFLPAALMTFFKTGPFAWDGLFGFWIPAGAFFAWIFVMTALLIQAIKQPAAD